MNLESLYVDLIKVLHIPLFMNLKRNTKIAFETVAIILMIG